jgi:hypothetical protein
MDNELPSNVVVLDQELASNRNIVLSNKMYWNENLRCFIILVRRHQYIKALARKVESSELPPGFDTGNGASFVEIGTSFVKALERRATAAFLSGGNTTADGWELLSKPTKTKTTV